MNINGEIGLKQHKAQRKKRVEEIEQNICNPYNVKFVQIPDGNGNTSLMSESDVMGERVYAEIGAVNVSSAIGTQFT